MVSEPFPEKSGTCGRVRPGVEARVVDENDCEVAPGQAGELILRTQRPWAMNHGYYKNPEATARAWRNGWFHTGDIGHFDAEIQIEAMRNYQWHNVKPQVDEVEFPDGKRLIVLAEGRLVNLGCATGHPSFVMSASFTNQVLAQIELWQNSADYDKQVYTLPKKLDEKVAALHLAKVGAKLTKLTDHQAKYFGVPVEGPYKGENYRY